MTVAREAVWIGNREGTPNAVYISRPSALTSLAQFILQVINIVMTVAREAARIGNGETGNAANRQIIRHKKY
jgi:hypothetical protein